MQAIGRPLQLIIVSPACPELQHCLPYLHQRRLIKEACKHTSQDTASQSKALGAETRLCLFLHLICPLGCYLEKVRWEARKRLRIAMRGDRQWRLW